MFGIYIHIPYCTQKCIYCDFYSTATRKSKTSYLEALSEEFENRKNELSGSARTVYFGGGTPTNLTKEELEYVFTALKRSFDLSACEEMTVEANPEHLSADYLSFLRQLGFNRISIGVQSFEDEDLRFLNRRHTSKEAKHAILEARKQGFENISLDLMYNLPHQTLSKWEANLEQALRLSPEHISCYSLTVEEGTMLDRLVQTGKVSLPSEEESLRMFDYAMDRLDREGYEHYEVSNYCKPHFRSQHNSSYWHFVPYLGFGASAHSFDGQVRKWNPESIEAYIGMIKGNTYPEKETLSLKDRYNEYIMLSLRCKEGISREYIAEHFPDFLNHYDKNLSRISAYLSQSWHLQNRIAVELML